MTRITGATHFLAVAGVTTALVLGSIALSAPAAADTANYLKDLHGQGISTPGGDPEIKEWGWEVCALVALGQPYDKVRAQAVYNSGSKPQYGMSVEQADAIVHSAVANLCSDHR